MNPPLTDTIPSQADPFLSEDHLEVRSMVREFALNEVEPGQELGRTPRCVQRRHDRCEHRFVFFGTANDNVLCHVEVGANALTPLYPIFSPARGLWRPEDLR